MNVVKKIFNIKNTSSLISIIIHLIILVVILGALNFEPPREKYVEIGFGVPGGGSGGASPKKGNESAQVPVYNPVKPAVQKTNENTVKKIQEPVTKNKTPENNEDVISKKPVKEKKPDEDKPAVTTSANDNTIGTENSSPANNGSNSNVAGKGGAGTNPEGTGIGNGTGAGSGNGNGNGNGEGNGIGDGYSIDFGGRVRKIYSYIIPDYPEGVYKQADVKIRFNIMPDGTVGRITTLTKVDGRLENAAINSLRLWRFEPLTPNQRQLEQTVIITFPFRLR